jgi:uncharacterized protein (DUF697 family)
MTQVCRRNFIRKTVGSASSIIIAVIAVAAIVGGIAYFAFGDGDTSVQKPQQVTQTNNVETQETEKSKVTPAEPKVTVDPDVFCEQIAEVGEIFGEELTGATARTNVSNGPQVGCSWSGPYVMVYFGKDSYNRRNTGFGSENLVAYEGTDQEAVKKEKYAVHSGFEVEVKSDTGRAFRISQSTGRQTDLTPDQYKQIANIVNNVLNEHY